MPKNTSVTDTRLVRRSQQGDRRAFRALLNRYDWRLRGLAHALLLDPERVDAVLRVAYVRAWREVVRIDPREDAAAWLYRLVYNSCIDGLRRESTRIGAAPPTAPGVADAADTADAADPPMQSAPASGNGATPATTGGHSARVVEALAALAPADRVAVVLVDREGFAPEAAARILGLTPEVVQARLIGARARLTNQLADVLATPPAPAEQADAQTEQADAQTDRKAETRPDEMAEPRPDGTAESQPGEAAEPQPDGTAESQPGEAAEPRPDGKAASQPGEAAETQPDGKAASQPEETEARAETEAPPDAPQPAPEQPEAELGDTTSADPAETKVASRSAASGSSNGSSGAARTNGSDDSGGGAS
jgi:RNA polymerase sigma-70 factor, ECF subfamily